MRTTITEIEEGHRKDSGRSAKIGLISAIVAASAGGVLAAISLKPALGMTFMVIGTALFILNYWLLRKTRKPR